MTNMTAVESFNILISEVAELIDYEEIAEHEQKALVRGIKFDPESHNIYRFYIAVQPTKKYGKKLRQKRSYSRVNRVMVDIRLPIPEIVILGIFPTTTLDSGQRGLDLNDTNDEGLLEVGPVKLKLVGFAKSLARRKNIAILASRTDRVAQWVYLKPYIQTNLNYELEVLCLVPSNILSPHRHLICTTEFSENGRTIEFVYRRKVDFPDVPN